MGTIVKLSAMLLIGAFAATANAHIEFVQARLLSLDIYRFGLNARKVTPEMDAFLAVNLRVFRPGTNQQIAWTIQPETGLDLCPFKYVENR